MEREMNIGELTISDEEREFTDRFESSEDLRRFFEECDAREGPGVEPDWEEHKRVIGESRLLGLPAAVKLVCAT